MIRYSLRCAGGHVFDAWFRDSAAFEALSDRRSVACAVCGDLRVEKALMAPSLRAEERAAEPPVDKPSADKPSADKPAEPPPADMPIGSPPAPLSTPATPAERALAGLRRYLSEKADYVGRRFAEEARRVHAGEAEERAIWGEATLEDARALAEDGLPVAPLPWLPRRDD